MRDGPSIYAISPPVASLGRQRWLRRARRCLDAGVDWLQVRDRDLPANRLLSLCRKVVNESGGERLLVNDRPDIALAAGAAGVHLRSSSVSPSVIRETFPGLVIACSAHSREEAARRIQEGADFLALGPVFETPSKAAYGPPMGIDTFTAIAERSPIPVYALGGIRLENLPLLFDQGIDRIAGISLFFGRTAPFASLRKIAKLHLDCPHVK